MVQVMVIVPYESFGPVGFGSSEEVVVAAMGQPDHVWEQGLSFGFFHIHFDAFGCAAAELFCSSRDEVAPVVDGDLRLVGEFDAVVQALQQRGFETRQGPAFLRISYIRCGVTHVAIRLWHETEDIVGIESICAFRRDVYQRIFHI